MRLVMKMLGAGKPGLDDHPHLKRVGLLTETGMDGELLTAKVECGPDVFGRFRKDLKAMEGKNDPVSVRRKSLLQILTSFQAMYMQGAIVVSEDDSAEEAGAIETEDVSSEDLAAML